MATRWDRRVHSSFIRLRFSGHLALLTFGWVDATPQCNPPEGTPVNLQRSGYVAGIALTAMLSLTACGSDNPTPAGGAQASAASGSCAGGSLTAQGSSAQKNAMDEWIKTYQGQCADAKISYEGTGSGAGIQAFISGTADFAGSDSALKEEEQPKADAKCAGGQALNLPMVIGPIAVVYNVDGVDNLQLSPETLAGIFAGKITKWNDPKPAESVWTFGNAKAWKAPGGTGAAKSDGVATQVKNTPGTISYVELSFAENSDLKKAKIKNGAGEYAELTGESAGKTIAGAKVAGTGSDLALSIDYSTTEAGAYPIVLVTYEIACSKGSAKAKDIQAFLK